MTPETRADWKAEKHKLWWKKHSAIAYSIYAVVATGILVFVFFTSGASQNILLFLYDVAMILVWLLVIALVIIIIIGITMLLRR